MPSPVYIYYYDIEKFCLSNDIGSESSLMNKKGTIEVRHYPNSYTDTASLLEFPRSRSPIQEKPFIESACPSNTYSRRTPPTPVTHQGTPETRTPKPHCKSCLSQGNLINTSDAGMPDKSLGINHTKWSVMYEELRRYKERHGNTNVPQNYQKNRKLGAWVKNQRQIYKRYKRGINGKGMTEERIESLESLDFRWTCNQSSKKLYHQNRNSVHRIPEDEGG
mmetsp:Transcript_22599/g.27718  ORF Transcript_22599/g.27718 Transcript_22599/m.27718 type:complete len:221 (+) Transcript_22599:240-902(+)